MTQRIGLRVGAVVAALGTALAAGCGGYVTDQPYESCAGGDLCAGGLTCAATTLPVSSGYTGALCTSQCAFDSDCLQVPASFGAACVNGQCYLSCPSSQACPFGQGCFTFVDQTGAPISLCTP